MMKIASLEDRDQVLEYAMKFFNSTPYKDLGDEATIAGIIDNFLQSPKEEKIIILDEGKGFLIAAITKFPFGNTKVATEIGWYVEPEFRNQGVGDQLVEAFEYWADKLGVKVKTLAFMDKDLTEYMKKKGYVPYETAHYKMG